MNDFARPDHLSPAGEAVVRANGIGTTPDFDVDLIIEIVCSTFHVGQSKQTAFACICQVLRDLQSLSDPDAIQIDWISALKLCRARLEESLGITESQALLVTARRASGACRMMLSRFSERIGASQLAELRQLRARTVLFHLSSRNAIANAFGAEFARISAGATPAALELGQRVRNDREALIEARKLYLAVSREAIFITSSLVVVDGTLHSPPILARKPAATTVPSAAATSENEETDDSLDDAGDTQNSTDAAPDAPAEDWDLIDEMVRRETFARARDKSGIGKSWANLEEFELEHAAKRFIADLQTSDCLIALAALLAIFLHLFPGRYASLPLRDTGHAAVWLDLKTGCLCWRLECAIDRERWLRQDGTLEMRAPVMIPLPIEIWLKLCELLRANPNAGTLAELFTIDLQELERAVRKYLRGISASSHTVTLGRLCTSFGRLILAVSGDETYARALGMDLTLGASASLNYFALRADRANSILRECYRRLGFSGELSSPIVSDTGSRFVGVTENVAALMCDALQAATKAFARALHRHDEATLIAAHNTIAISVLLLLIIVTGARAAKNFCFAAHTLDLDLLLAILADKEILGIRESRIVPLPRIAVAWLEFYFKWLCLLKGRLQRLNPRAAELIDSITRNANGRAAISLFFFLEADFHIRPLQNSDVAESFRKHGVESNVGRHWGDAVLRDGGGDSALVAAWLGHSARGQEPFGVYSLLQPINEFEKMRSILDARLDSYKLPAAPSLKAPQKSKKRFSGKGNFVPGGFESSATEANSSVVDVDSSPFGEFTLARARQFVEMVRAWGKVARSSTPGNLVASLIFSRGLVNEEVLIPAALELISRLVYYDGQNHFVQVIAKKTGIHRVWVDGTSVRLGSKVAATGVDENQLRKLASATLAPICKVSGIEKCCGLPLTAVLDCARAFYSLWLPGLLRGLMFGDIASRTLRVEALARERLDFVEHPTIATGSRRRSALPISDEFILTEIKYACDTTRYQGTDKTRVKKLGERLQAWLGKPLDHPILDVYLAFAIYLAGLPLKPSTILRYYDAVRKFIFLHCRDIASTEELCEMDWETLVKEFKDQHPATSGDGNDPAVSALNHFLESIEVDLLSFQKTNPFSASFRFVDYLSTNACERALKLLPEISALSPQRTAQACTLFRVLESVFPRWVETSRARAVDVSGSGDRHLVITHEAMGMAKSVNADRVLPITDDELAHPLFDLRSARIKQSGGDDAVFLFGDAASLMSVSEVEEIRRLVGNVLYAVSGSNSVSPHSFRPAGATLAVMAMLDPAKRKNMSTLELRNGLYLVAYLMAHGHPGTTVGNYLCRADEALRDCVAALAKTVLPQPSPLFMSALTNIPADTLRTRTRRDSKLAVYDPLEGFDPAEHPEFSSRLRPLGGFVVPGVNLLPIEPQEPGGNVDGEIAIYTAARICGIDKDTAALCSQIRKSDQAAVDRGLAQIFAAAGHALTCPPISPAELTEGQFLRQVAAPLSGWQPSAEEALGVCRMLDRDISQPWTCRGPDDVKAASVPLEHLERSRVAIIFSHSKDAPGDVDTMFRFLRSKNTCRDLSSRKFRRDVAYRIQFVPAGTDHKALPVHVRRTTFFVTSAVLAKAAFHIGVQHHGL